MKYQVSIFDEKIVDSFAGGGGASTGIELATGRPVDWAINHDIDAVRMHMTNHPYTTHLQTDVWDVDPKKLAKGAKVGLAWFSPDCFAKGTMILTQSGYKPIENVIVGDMVLTHKLRWRKVTNTMLTERDEMVIQGYGNPTLVCSTGHPFYVKTRTEKWNKDRHSYDHLYSEPSWKKAKELTTKDYLGVPVKAEPIPIPEMEKIGNKATWLPVDEWLMYLAGRYTGDGWTRKTDTRSEVVIVCGETEIEYLSKKLNMWPRSGGRVKPGELAWQFRKVRTGGQFTANSRSLVKWLRQNFGHLASGKRIPGWLLGAPKEYKEAFLEGYLGADGWDNGNLHEISTVSKALAHGIRSLVATMGYSPMIYLNETPNRIIEERMVNAKPCYKVKWRRSIVESHRQTFVADDILWAPIRSAQETGNRKLFYNISVEEDESYVAEGVIVHNCKHFSKARGGKPVDKKIRGLSWFVIRWALDVRPRVIMMENVEEIQTWGPVIKRDGKWIPDPDRVGETFQAFIGMLTTGVPADCPALDEVRFHLKLRKNAKEIKQLIDGLGYDVEFKELVAADYGAPTTRKRFVLVARCDGKPIVWPERTHAPRDSEEVKSGKLQPWRSAAEIIDWSQPTYSIFDSKKKIKKKYGVNAVRPLADNTLRRVIRGVDKFTIKSGAPFLVECNHGGEGHLRSVAEPVNTVTGKYTGGVCNPVMAPFTFGNTGGSVGSPADQPVHTIRSAGSQVFSAANLIQYHSEQTEAVRASGLDKPIHTVDAANRHGLASAQLVEYYGNGNPLNIRQPMHTVTARDREALTIAHMQKYFDGGYKGCGADARDPLATVTAIDHNALCAAHVVKFKGKELGQHPTDTLNTITAQGLEYAECRTVLAKVEPGKKLGHWPKIRNLLNKYCGYSLAKDEVLLIIIWGVAYYIADITLRMLTPRELYNAMGFPPDYIIDRDCLGNVCTKANQVARCGNAVCPPLAEAMVRANLPEWCGAKFTTMREWEAAVAV